MYRLLIALKKELLILWNDKTGLSLMFFMPVLLVYIITIIQDSAFKVVNENNITMLVVNKDRGEEGNRLIEMLRESNFFTLTEDNSLDSNALNKNMNDESLLTGLYIPQNFSAELINKSSRVGGILMQELGLSDPAESSDAINMPQLKFHHDPVLQENYCTSIVNVINAYVKSIEGDLLITQLCKQLELDKAPEKLRETMLAHQVTIQREVATLSETTVNPNSTQHNVPAWTIFAIFFMVISLGNNIVKERLNGSFIRLKTMPTSFSLILGAKFLVYVFAVLLQVLVIFTLARLTFPAIGLPALVMPDNILAFFIVVLMTGISAISFATAVGAAAGTQEQANGFGAITIVIFAAIGGIWVPSFVMPEYLRFFSYSSPLYWCLESFYTLFLRGGNWSTLLPNLLGLLIFSILCFGFAFLRLKKNKII